MQMSTGFAPLAARYDGFILDLWGVIHDGVSPYTGALDVLARLRTAGKPVVLLSNAPRRAAVAQAAMRAAMAIPDDLYSGILTSGEGADWPLSLKFGCSPPWAGGCTTSARCATAA